YAPAVGEEKQLQTHEADDSIYQTTLGSVTEQGISTFTMFLSLSSVSGQ
ncbi:unnamed protein product, partial [Rotaria socialis]